MKKENTEEKDTGRVLTPQEEDSYSVFRRELKDTKKKAKRVAVLTGVICLVAGAVIGGTAYFVYSGNEETRLLKKSVTENWLYKGNYTDTELDTAVKVLKNGENLVSYFDQFTAYAKTKEDLGLTTSYSGVYGFSYVPTSVYLDGGTRIGGEKVTRIIDGNLAHSVSEEKGESLEVGDVFVAFRPSGEENYTYIQDVPHSYVTTLSVGNSPEKKADLLFLDKDDRSYKTFKGVAPGSAGTIPVTLSSSDENKKQLSLKIWTFVTDNGHGVADALKSYLSSYVSAWGEIDSLVLDLRDNGGGYTSDGYYSACLFLPKGSTVYAEGDNELNVKKRYVQGGDPSFSEEKVKKISLLVNKNSASCTELFANALVENDRAKLYGSRSYGKGVQQLVLNIDGLFGRKYGVLKVTNSKILTPKGNCVENEFDAKGNISVHHGMVPEDSNRTDISYYTYNENIVTDAEIEKEFSLTGVDGKTYSFGTRGLTEYGKVQVLDELKKTNPTSYSSVNPTDDKSFRNALKAYQVEKNIYEEGKANGLYDTRTMYALVGELESLYAQGQEKELKFVLNRSI